MCVAPLERWPKVRFTHAFMPSEGFRGSAWSLEKGPCSREQKEVCCALSYVLSLHFQMVPRPRGRCPGCGGFPVVPQVSRERWTLKETLPPIFSKATQAKKNKI